MTTKEASKRMRFFDIAKAVQSKGRLYRIYGYVIMYDGTYTYPETLKEWMNIMSNYKHIRKISNLHFTSLIDDGQFYYTYRGLKHLDSYRKLLKV